MLRLSNAVGQLYASFRSRASLTAKVAGFGRIFPLTCKKARIATSAVDDPENHIGRRSSRERQINPISGFQLWSLLLQLHLMPVGCESSRSLGGGLGGPIRSGGLCHGTSRIGPLIHEVRHISDLEQPRSGHGRIDPEAATMVLRGGPKYTQVAR